MIDSTRPSDDREPSPGGEARDDLAACLRTFPLFTLLSRESLERVARTVRPRRLDAGERIFDAGEVCHGFYAVRQGTVKLYRLSPDAHEQVLHHITAGRTFAEAALLNLGVYPVSAAAVAPDTEVLEFQGPLFLPLFREDPAIAPAMVGSLCGRLHQLVERVDDLSVTSAAARLARYLLRLPARRTDQGHVVSLPLAKKELAAHLAMTPETLSRLLRAWSDQGTILSDRSRLVLMQAHRLLGIADGTSQG